MTTTTPQRPPVQRIEVIGRRWFARTYGNTYHTVEIYVNDERVYKSPHTYGYDSGYVQTAKAWLIENGYLPAEDAKYGSMRMICEELGIAWRDTVMDVPRQKDL